MIWLRVCARLLTTILIGYLLSVAISAQISSEGVISYTAYGQSRLAQIELVDIGRGIVYRPPWEASNLPASWSPDGQRVAYIPTIEGNLVIRDVFTGQRITPMASQVLPSYVVWAHQEEWIGFVVADEIWAYNLSESRTYRFLRPGNVSVMSWSPDANDIVYTSQRGINMHVYHYNRNNGENVRLVSTDAQSFGVYSPVYSPDGCCIAYIFNAGLNFRVQLYNIATQTNDLLYTADTVTSLTWSADGKHLLFSEPVRDEGYHIFMMDIETGDLHRITWGDGHYENPRWVPWD